METAGRASKQLSTPVLYHSTAFYVGIRQISSGVNTDMQGSLNRNQRQRNKNKNLRGQRPGEITNENVMRDLKGGRAHKAGRREAAGTETLQTLKQA